MPRRKHLSAAVLAVWLTVPGVAGASAAGALALEARLNAPCCFNGTLDIHDSDLAKSLRSEIEHRLAAGETADTIQADFVARYGDRVIAARSESPIRALGLSLAALAVVAAAVLALALRRWTRRQEGPSTELPRHDQLDERIDAELADLDGE
ncbi:MAG: cytochrome c-type biogenesis protein CcmH [Labilithrix sp.]